MTVSTPDLKEERRLRKEGHEWVAGLDEVGRGAWAGPLTIGVALVRPRVQLRSMPSWLRDSKQLSEARREEIFEKVGAWCPAWSVGHASAAECDEWGMTEAWRMAARRALAGLTIAPDDTTMARVALVLGSRGTLKTLTLSAIPIDDYIEGVLKAGKA